MIKYNKFYTGRLFFFAFILCELAVIAGIVFAIRDFFTCEKILFIPSQAHSLLTFVNVAAVVFLLLSLLSGFAGLLSLLIVFVVALCNSYCLMAHMIFYNSDALSIFFVCLFFSAALFSLVLLGAFSGVIAVNVGTRGVVSIFVSGHAAVKVVILYFLFAFLIFLFLDFSFYFF